MSLNVSKLLYNPGSTTYEATISTEHESKGVQLPKLEVPTFDGDVLHWQMFWEQLLMTVKISQTLKSLCICAIP